MMKLWKSSENMEKNALKIKVPRCKRLNIAYTFYISCLICMLGILSCSSPLTYQRKDIAQLIQNICHDEFDLPVSVWDMGQTVWIYTPFDWVLERQTYASIDRKVQEKIGKIYQTLRRIILNMDIPPKFYCFVVSDIKDIGVDLYYVGYVQDLIKVNLSLLSLAEWQEREYFQYFVNPKALKDTNGAHIQKYDFQLSDFIAKLIKQHFERTFAPHAQAEAIKIHDAQSIFYQGKINLSFDIEIIKTDADIPNPFEVAEQSAIKYLKIYPDAENILEIQITDQRSKQTRFYTRRSLLESE